MKSFKHHNKFDLSTVNGRYRAQQHEHAMGKRKRPPSKKSVMAEMAAEDLETVAISTAKVENVPVPKKKAKKKGAK